MFIEKLKKMFQEVTINKNAQSISQYYHPDFLLYTNNMVWNYTKFLDMHVEKASSPIKYLIEYDEETFLEKGHKVAGRVFITTSMPGEETHRIEVLLIANYKDGKIYRLWELTYPDWSQLPEFKDN